MKVRVKLVAAVVAVAALGIAITAAVAGGEGGSDVKERLSGYEEVPAVSTPATGEFRAKVKQSSGEIPYRLTYSTLSGTVQQAHIHIGQFSVNGAISVFLCSNLGNGPAGTQPCPPAPATIEGTIKPADVTNNASGQGVSAGEFAELAAAIKAGVTYVNVHSSTFPGGEIRSQLLGNHDRDQD